MCGWDHTFCFQSITSQYKELAVLYHISICFMAPLPQKNKILWARFLCDSLRWFLKTFPLTITVLKIKFSNISSDKYIKCCLQIRLTFPVTELFWECIHQISITFPVLIIVTTVFTKWVLSIPRNSNCNNVFYEISS